MSQTSTRYSERAGGAPCTAAASDDGNSTPQSKALSVRIMRLQPIVRWVEQTIASKWPVSIDCACETMYFGKCLFTTLSQSSRRRNLRFLDCLASGARWPARPPADVRGAAHSRSSSGCESRIIRMGYGADSLYTRMAMRSLLLWKELANVTSETLFHRTGVLWSLPARAIPTVPPRNPLSSRRPACQSSRQRNWLPDIHSFDLPGEDVYNIFEPESGALMARRAVSAVVRDAVARGLDYAIEAVQASPLEV